MEVKDGIVWSVELRENKEGQMDYTLMHISSTVDKAQEYIVKNQDAAEGEFWWAVCFEQIDVDMMEQKHPERDLFIFNKKGEEIYWQPGGPRDAIYYGDRIRFCYQYNSTGKHNDDIFEGTLVKCENQIVYLKDVIYIEENRKDISELKKPFLAEISQPAGDFHNVWKEKDA